MRIKTAKMSIMQDSRLLYSRAETMYEISSSFEPIYSVYNSCNSSLNSAAKAKNIHDTVSQHCHYQSFLNTKKV